MRFRGFQGVSRAFLMIFWCFRGFRDIPVVYKRGFRGVPSVFNEFNEFSISKNKIFVLVLILQGSILNHFPFNRKCDF